MNLQKTNQGFALMLMIFSIFSIMLLGLSSYRLIYHQTFITNAKISAFNAERDANNILETAKLNLSQGVEIENLNLETLGLDSVTQIDSVFSNIHILSAQSTSHYASSSQSVLISEKLNEVRYYPNIDLFVSELKNRTDCNSWTYLSDHDPTTSLINCQGASETIESSTLIPGNLLETESLKINRINNQELTLLVLGQMEINNLEISENSQATIAIIALGEINIHSLTSVNNTNTKILIYSLGRGIEIDSTIGPMSVCSEETLGNNLLLTVDAKNETIVNGNALNSSCPFLYLPSSWPRVTTLTF
jgi:hypothetical protein